MNITALVGVKRTIFISLSLLLLLGGLAPAAADEARRGPLPGVTTRVSVSSAGEAANKPSTAPALSANGRFIAFESDSDNLVAEPSGLDANGLRDIFLHDIWTATTSRVSVASSGSESNGASQSPAISADGRFIAFVSYANNLVAGDTNMQRDIFVRDLDAAVTTRVSVAIGGAEADGYSVTPDLSSDGRYIVFASSATNLVAGDNNGNPDIFVHDRLTGDLSRVSTPAGGGEADGASYDPAISGDGRFVVFASSATNLVPDDANGVHDLFLVDRQTGDVTRVSRGWNGAESDGPSQAPAISAEGRFITFYSAAANLTPGDTNGQFDVFLYDRRDASIELISVGAAGEPANGPSYYHAVSRDGRLVTFISYADNLVAGDANGGVDIFVRDRLLDRTRRVNLGADGQEAPGSATLRRPTMSADGELVGYDSDAFNLIPGDENGADDIFVHRLAVPMLTHQSYAPAFIAR